MVWLQISLGMIQEAITLAICFFNTLMDNRIMSMKGNSPKVKIRIRIPFGTSQGVGLNRSFQRSS
jgi:hypothetical protein